MKSESGRKAPPPAPDRLMRVFALATDLKLRGAIACNVVIREFKHARSEVSGVIHSRARTQVATCRWHPLSVITFATTDSLSAQTGV